ncbi:MAG: helix-turn-helix transcriptional regulator [Patescibacteria group bacterium]|nr:helix-turn-helix transcriptional regulator [Patescibacteria group bacterium]
MRPKSGNPIDVYVGRRIRMRRMMLGLSQEKLAEAIGVTFQQVQKQERGTNRVSASALSVIAGRLKVPVSFFFEGAPNAEGHPAANATPDYAQAFLATTDGLSIARSFVKLEPKLRRRFVDLVEEMAG